MEVETVTDSVGEVWTLDDAIPAIDRTLYENGLQTFIGWMRQQDPTKEVNPSMPCGCFLWEYFTNVYDWGEWAIREDELSEYNLHIYYDYDTIPKWYTRFQGLAMDTPLRRNHQGSLTYAEAITIAEGLLASGRGVNSDSEGEDE